MSDEQLATKLKQIVQEIADVATAGLRSDRVDHLERTIRIVYNILQSERKEGGDLLRRVEPTAEERAAAERWSTNRWDDYRGKLAQYVKDAQVLAAYAARVLAPETADGK